MIQLSNFNLPQKSNFLDLKSVFDFVFKSLKRYSINISPLDHLVFISFFSLTILREFAKMIEMNEIMQRKKFFLFLIYLLFGWEFFFMLSYFVPFKIVSSLAKLTGIFHFAKINRYGFIISTIWMHTNGLYFIRWHQN